MIMRNAKRCHRRSVCVCVCCVFACVCMCVCVFLFVYLVGGLVENELRQICNFFTFLQAIKKPSNYLLGNVVIRDLELFCEGQRFESRQFEYIKRCYLANADKLSNYYNCQHIGSRSSAFSW